MRYALQPAGDEEYLIAISISAYQMFITDAIWLHYKYQDMVSVCMDAKRGIDLQHTRRTEGL